MRNILKRLALAAILPLILLGVLGDFMIISMLSASYWIITGRHTDKLLDTYINNVAEELNSLYTQ